MYKKKNQLEREGNTSILFWLLTGFIVLFMFWAPFQKGLFNGNTYDFERPLYSAFVWGFIILFITSLFLFYHWRFKDHGDILSIVVWLLPITFLLAKINEASHYYATNMVYIEMLYAVFFILGIYLCRNSLGNRILTFCIMLSGYVVVWFGMINWLGYKEFAAKLVNWFVNLPTLEYKDAVMMASNELRLTSTFQYANSFAAFLIALLLAGSYLIVSNRKPVTIAIHSFMLVPMILSLLLSLSRGGLVILPVVLLLILPFLKIAKQIFIFIHFVVAAVISLIILNKITLVGEQFHLHQDLSTAATGLWILIGASVGCAIVCWLLQHFLYPKVEGFFNNRLKMRFANILLPAAALIIGLLGIFVVFGNTGAINLFPDYIKHRIETINLEQHSVLERGTFYKDSVKLFKDYPVTGAGGGAWAALYEKYQNNPYVSRQAHNFFIQYLVETGIVGVLVLLAFLVYIYYLYIRQYIKNTTSSQENSNRHVFFIVTISLLVHSMIDFDLSYVYLGALLFLSLGGMISGSEQPALSEKWLIFNKYKWIYPSVLVILSIFMFFSSTRMLNANSSFQASISMAQSNKTINEIFVPLNNALNQHPNHPDYASYKIDFLLQVYSQTKDENFFNQAVDLIQKVRAKEPNNRALIDKEVYTLAIKDQLPKALELVNKEINNFPWDITLYEKSILMNFDLGSRAQTAKNNAQAEQYWSQAFGVYNAVLEKAKQLESLPKEQLQGRPFGLTKNMAFTLGQIDFMHGKFASAESFFKFQLSDQFNEQINVEMARWYLASLQKQNKNDQALYDKLISKDPKEKDEINKLITATFSGK
ncbi:O-antigen ligase family protein [Paenibacillus sp. OAS669]|uniref:O-antigen ligase family protein n=1 Tax=Paenibacillus sp. OAS669 TaxID=2663821 RepID=UPI00178B43FE|nr:O-antigen ligase family protein [Paenibacillus sp. OAS669]MBE1445681.1 tetratricopeptide (TPR) repeat protein [Paenibacillus sp. OAS669]